MNSVNQMSSENDVIMVSLHVVYDISYGQKQTNSWG